MSPLKLPKFLKKTSNSVSGWIRKRKSVFIHSGLLFGAVALITILIAPSSQTPIRGYREGDIARETIRISENINIVDEQKTEAAKREAELTVLSVYDYDDAFIRNTVDKLSQAFNVMRRINESAIEPLARMSGQDSREVLKAWLDQRREFNEITGVDSSEEEFLLFAKNSFNQNMEKKIIDTLLSLEKRLIVGNMESLKNELGKGLIILNMHSRDGSAVHVKDFSNISDVDNTRAFIADRAKAMFNTYKRSSRKVIVDFMGRFVRPNLFINMQLTSARVDEARNSVKPVTISLQKGEVVFREGDRITKGHTVILNGITKAEKEISNFEIKLGLTVILFLIIVTTFLFAKAYIRKFSPSTRDLLMLLITSVSTVLLADLFIFISESLGERIPLLASPALKYAIPVAASAMLVRFSINSETAIIFSFVISMLMGYMFGGNITFAIYSFVGCIFGAYKVAYAKARFDLMKAGVMAGLINALVAVSIEMLGGKVFHGGYADLGLVVLMSLTSGVLIAMILPTLSTLAEAAAYLTDIKLIELSNFNNPLLNKLAIVAPGTYHHSRVVAQLVEVAAGTVHANPLLSQVLAFYHDIGKINQPEYFIENQGTGENKHDELKPSMSKMIIISHVKDGVDLARAHKVPKEIIDGIEQHHGTSLISFFYKKAKDQENPEVEQIDESEYRYPGPKPQTRETGLLMLADAVEASSKALQDPSPAQLQGVIQKVFNKAFTDGQLEDCELTLKDLHRIAASFFRVLVSIYKARIDYPEIPSKESHKKRENGDTPTKQAKEDKVRAGEDKENGKGNLKRIGIDK